jgi:ATP-dependent exoDNAse (exonuclease V) alpha subunit
LVIPVEPTTVTKQIKLEDKNKKMITRSVKRRQFPMTAAYTFTDYRSQGQTILLVLVDIASPPNGGLSLFNLYVALSRSSGRSTIRLLRDFDDEVFLRSHDAALMEEDKWLEELNRITLEWWAHMRRLDDA